MYNNIGIVKERMIMNKKIPRTFQKKLIFFNFLTIICIASAISFYTFFLIKMMSLPTKQKTLSTDFTRFLPDWILHTQR